MTEWHGGKGSKRRTSNEKSFSDNWDKIFREDKDMKGKTNPVKKNMDKLHKPSTHIDKSKYDRKSESEKMQDELEPIWYSTEHDESDDLEDAKRIEDDVNRMEDEGGPAGVMERKITKGNVFKDIGFTDEEAIALESEMDYSGAFESDVEEEHDPIKKKVYK